MYDLFVFGAAAPSTDPASCLLEENLAKCRIFLCRMMKRILAVPFPECYAK